MEPDLDMELHYALMASTAAPTYFPVHRGYTDGAVFANVRSEALRSLPSALCPLLGSVRLAESRLAVVRTRRCAP